MTSRRRAVDLFAVEPALGVCMSPGGACPRRLCSAIGCSRVTTAGEPGQPVKVNKKGRVLTYPTVAGPQWGPLRRLG